MFAFIRKVNEIRAPISLPLHRMCMLYMNQLRNADSAFICAEAAQKSRSLIGCSHIRIFRVFSAQKIGTW